MRRLAPLLLVALLALAGCRVGTGAPASSTSLLVTENFGQGTDLQLDPPKSAGGDTVLRLLERNAKVTTRFGGGFVQSIDGKAGGRQGGRPYDWFFYVNGVEAEKGAGAVKVEAGDRIWWDRHDWGQTQTIPAVVGSFPEPFLHGYDGRRLPTRLECTDPSSPACARVSKRLGEIGVVAGRGGLQTSLTKETNRVVAGLWPQVRSDDAVRSLEDGPRASGVYARPARDGRSIAILDPTGKVARTLGPGTGLVAATRFEGGRPVWIVTGTDAAGLAAAADALQEGDLQGHFALAVSAGQAVDVPLVARPPAGAAG